MKYICENAMGDQVTCSLTLKFI